MRVFLILFGIALTPVVLAIITEYLEKQPKQPKKTNPKKKKNSAGKEIQNDVYLECLSALKGLGMKSTEAKIKTKLMFVNRNYTKVEDFLMDVYKNE